MGPKPVSYHYCFVLKMWFAFYVYCIYSSALQTRFFQGSKPMNQNEQSDSGPYCLQYRLPKNISRQQKK